MMIHELRAILEFKNQFESKIGPMLRQFERQVAPLVRDTQALVTGFEGQIRKHFGLN